MIRKFCRRNRTKAAASFLAVLSVTGFFPSATSFHSHLLHDRSICFNLQSTNTLSMDESASDSKIDPVSKESRKSSSSSSRDRENTDGISLGKVGDWEFLHGNWVLRPPSTEEVPRAVLHFLGGALVGASPHITYRYLLERLAEKGFLIIATPYQLSFDHLQTCDEVISRFERMAPSIARQYGALPVVGIGHSCGALLQLLITSLFPDTPRAANALISFNNKPVSDAVPFFEEIFAPFFTAIATNNGTFSATSNEVLSLSLQLAKTATEGRIND